MSGVQSQRAMIQKFINALREQGFLNQNFDNQTNLYENENPLAKFCEEAEPRLEQAQISLEGGNVDYPKVISLMEQIQGDAASVGGNRLAIACAELQQLCRANNFSGSNEAYRKVLWEYYILRDCFHHILQAERSIHYGRD